MWPEERSLMATRRRAFGNIRPAGKSSWQASYKVNGQTVRRALDISIKGRRQRLAGQHTGGHQQRDLDRPDRR